MLSRLSDLLDPDRPDDAVLDRLPRGCSKFMQGSELVVRASLRSIGGALGLLFFALFWNGIVSIFVLIALAGLYTNLIGPLPDWVPLKMGDVENNGMTLGMTLFLCIFLIPFVTIGIALIGGILISLIGSVEVRLLGEAGRVRTGFGPFRWTRRFDATQVRSVKGGRTSYQVNDESKELIVIKADHEVRFGSMLPDDRRRWMRAVLHVLLVGDASKRADVLDRASGSRDFRQP